MNQHVLYAKVDEHGRLRSTAYGRAKTLGRPDWATHEFPLPGMPFHPDDWFVRDGELRERQKITLKTDRPTAPVGEQHTVRARDPDGNELNVRILVDRQYYGTTPETVIWDDAGHVRCELPKDTTPYRAEPIRLRWRERQDDPR